ncbi:MAG: hypothetical protein FJZ01_17120 [Candidatus Sericytochromatia bacterium]|nr:hypothetical protein [Candidatus Tanganyikabacteria bacterium]
MADEPVDFTPIACARLDKENAEWARKYVARWRSRLEADGDDPELAAYGRREIAAYTELLERFGQAAT